MKSCAAERTNTDRCYLYKRKDVERNVDAKLGGTVLVLFLLILEIFIFIYLLVLKFYLF